MPRALEPGEIGNITFETDPNSGKARARARFRRLDGEISRVMKSGRTEREARLAVTRAAMTQMQSTFIRLPGASLTPASKFGKLVQAHIEYMAEGAQHIRPQTRNENIRVERKHVLGAPIAQKRIREVTGADVILTYNRLVDAGKEATARQTLWRMRELFDYAFQLGLVTSNPARTFRPRKRPAKDVHVPSEFDLRDLRAVVQAWRQRPHRSGPMPSSLLVDVIELMLGTGARIGEAMGLRWKDVHLDGEVPTVSFLGTVVEGHNLRKHYQAATKTSAGMRDVPVPEFVVEMLRRRATERELDYEFVFSTRLGTPNGPQDVRRQLANVRRWSQSTDEVPTLTDDMVTHALRRAVATAVASASDIGTAAKLLGHRESGVTERHYAKRALQAPDVRDILQQLSGRDE